MAVRTHVGNAALYLTAHPDKDDLIVLEYDDDVWLVMGNYVLCDNAMHIYTDDLVHSLFDWSIDDDAELQ